MMRRIILVLGSLAVLSCLPGCLGSGESMLAASAICGLSQQLSQQYDWEQEMDSIWKKVKCVAVGVEGKAAIENLEIGYRDLQLQLRNLTSDNVLDSVHFEFSRIRSNGERMRLVLFNDKMRIPPGGLSEVIRFEPWKVFNYEGEMRITVLGFKDPKDDYYENGIEALWEE